MFKFLALGLGVGVGVQSWRNFPADGPLSPDSAAFVFIVGLVFAYLAGRWRGRGGAYASASASAVAVAESVASASNSLNLSLVMLGEGARPSGVSQPSESAPWFVQGAPERRQVTADELDGMDVAELLTEPAYEAEQ